MRTFSTLDEKFATIRPAISGNEAEKKEFLRAFEKTIRNSVERALDTQPDRISNIYNNDFAKLEVHAQELALEFIRKQDSLRKDTFTTILNTHVSRGLLKVIRDTHWPGMSVNDVMQARIFEEKLDQQKLTGNLDKRMVLSIAKQIGVSKKFPLAHPDYAHLFV